MFSINQGTNEDDSQNNPHPEAGLLTSGRDMATGVQRECAVGQDNCLILQAETHAIYRQKIGNLRVGLPATCGCGEFCMHTSGTFASVPHVSLPMNCLLIQTSLLAVTGNLRELWMRCLQRRRR